MQIWQDMLKQDLILQIINQTDHYLKGKIRVTGLMKDELGGKRKSEFVA